MTQETRVADILSRMAKTTHRAGTFGTDVLMAMAETLPSGPIRSLETGCGKSTVMFSNISAKHLVFAYDDRDLPDSSVQMVLSSPDFRKETTEFVFGPTQNTIPKFNFGADNFFDVVVIDGPHGYPFPDLEYAFLYPHLREGSLLIVDDIHIPSIGHMYDLLRADRMYDEVGVFASTGVLRRTAIKGVPPDGDHWFEQNYNVSQFPRSMAKYKAERSIAFDQRFDLSNEAAVQRHMQRGAAFDAASGSALTIDLGSVFEFKLAQSGGTADLEFEYRSASEAAALSASVVSGGASARLPFASGFQRQRLKVPVGPGGGVQVTFLAPNALPEHDLGHARYDFRRLGLLIKSFTFKPDGSGQALQNAKRAKPPARPKSIKKRVKRLLGLGKK